MGGWIRTEQDIESNRDKGLSPYKRTLLTRDPLVDRTYTYIDHTFGIVRREVYLDIETFQDLGEPDTITITIEPGDTLN